MSDTIIAALIAAAVAIVTNVITNAVTASKANALIMYRIDQLETKMDKHNNVIERMAVAEQDIKTAFRQLNEVKSELKEVEKEAKE